MGLVIKKYLSDRVENISKVLKIPKITVERVIREYLKGLIDSALKGETIVIDNIVSIKILRKKETGELIVRARISSSLRNKLKGIRLDIDTDDVA